jgi:hypothetical protein
MTVAMATEGPQTPMGGTCPNCSAELTGPYCAACGQRQVDLDQPQRELVSGAMDAFLALRRLQG